MKAKYIIHAVGTILITLLFFVGIYFLKTTSTEEPKERYYFIGFVCDDGTSGANWIIVKDNEFITYQTAINKIRAYQKLKGKIAITSLYEFKSGEEYDRFISDYK